ncbi:hypothetical protein KIN20_038440 [Parelaphostrongylus tenuis]|uniref:Uncharacterized protein n=1 Tax=Parelaphostrongylus tenuis TaxID=148309 RepID=A0AAD5R0A3_PARTN|nr:hypothetical protein KIN20_038440 [Parelaphostrongylus tenuis]
MHLARDAAIGVSEMGHIVPNGLYIKPFGHVCTDSIAEGGNRSHLLLDPIEIHEKNIVASDNTFNNMSHQYSCLTIMIPPSNFESLQFVRRCSLHSFTSTELNICSP